MYTLSSFCGLYLSIYIKCWCYDICFIPKITSSIALMHSTTENIFAYFVPYHCHYCQPRCITLSAVCALNLVLCSCNYVSLVLLCNRPQMLWHNLPLFFSLSEIPSNTTLCWYQAKPFLYLHWLKTWPGTLPDMSPHVSESQLCKQSNSFTHQPEISRHRIRVVL